jgi:hypothetical protein
MTAIAVVPSLLMGLAGSIPGPATTACAAEPLRNIETQRREFSISIDGTKRGRSTMRIRRRSDGSTLVRSESEIRINYLVYRYNYTSSGAELWKDGRVVALQNSADFNGTRYHVKAVSNRKSLQLTVDGTVSEMPPDVWPSSYWQTPDKLPLADSATQAPGDPRFVLILDCDQGRKLRSTLTKVGDETLAVAGEQKVCTHYRVTGDANLDFWYDPTGRLVRQDSVERGHQVRFELNEIAAD